VGRRITYFCDVCKKDKHGSAALSFQGKDNKGQTWGISRGKICDVCAGKLRVVIEAKLEELEK